VEGPVLLDLGCGHKHEEGWLRVDLPVERKKVVGGMVDIADRAIDPDIPCDLRAIPLPDNYADGARAIHVIEHFQPWEATKLVREWVRVLKPGAELAIECPCLDKIIKLFDVPHCPPNFTYWGLYGDPRLEDPLMMHHWCYTQGQLVRVMGQAGLVNLRPEPVRFHEPIRDMRIVGQKPIPESRIVVPE
jgi:SAM-dependent methyltransferase